MPFFAVEADVEAEIVLAQVSDRRFRLVRPFRYVAASGEYIVTPEDLPGTDLASVPWPLRWFASGYGRHTAAALLHDHLVDSGARLAPPVSRKSADRIFLEALEDLGVPLVRRRLMWAAVTLGTRFSQPWLRGRAGIVLWGLAAVTGIALFVLGATGGNLALSAIAAVAPVPFALLWGEEAPAGLIAGYGVLVVGPPTVGVLIGYGVYWVVEWMAVWLLSARPGGEPGVPRPTPYRQF